MAALILTLMVVPITSSICRELFTRVPRDLSEGALALGATRWETIRGVSIPYAGPGIVAAVLLGLGRAFGEAIAVTQVIGGGNGIHRSLFATGDTLASRIASEYQGAVSGLQIDSLLYLGAILLVISLITNVAAQIGRSALREVPGEDRMSSRRLRHHGPLGRPAPTEDGREDLRRHRHAQRGRGRRDARDRDRVGGRQGRSTR